MFFEVSTESKIIHPKSRTHTVFMCPNTCISKKLTGEFLKWHAKYSQFPISLRHNIFLKTQKIFSK